MTLTPKLPQRLIIDWFFLVLNFHAELQHAPPVPARAARYHSVGGPEVIDIETMLAGDLERPEYSLEELSPGTVVRIQLPDPFTMEYP